MGSDGDTKVAAIEIAFAGGSLERDDARRRDDAWLSAQLDGQGEGRCLPLWRGRPLIQLGEARGEAALAWIDVTALESIRQGATWVLLGEDKDGRGHFALDVSAAPRDHALFAGVGRKFIDARSIAPDLPAPAAGVLAQARSMLEWHRTHPKCARCGADTQLVEGGYRRHCDACGADHYPRTDPVAIMVVEDASGERCLLGRKPTFPPGLFTCLAGFVEPGETIEEAVAREVEEESGVRVQPGSVRYIASQPWPFPSQLMIGCQATAAPGSEAIRVDQDELEEARWFTRAELREVIELRHPELVIPPPMAIAHQLVRQWVLARVDGQASAT